MDRTKKLFVFIGPKDSGKSTLAQTLAQNFPEDFAILPRLCDRFTAGKEPSKVEQDIGAAAYNRKVAAGRLILRRTHAERRTGYDRRDLERLLKRQHVVLVTDGLGIEELVGSGLHPILVRIVPRNGMAPAADRTPLPVGLRARLEILNSFTPGGLESAQREVEFLSQRLLMRTG